MSLIYAYCGLDDFWVGKNAPRDGIDSFSVITICIRFTLKHTHAKKEKDIYDIYQSTVNYLRVYCMIRYRGVFFTKFDHHFHFRFTHKKLQIRLKRTFLWFYDIFLCFLGGIVGQNGSRTGRNRIPFDTQIRLGRPIPRLRQCSIFHWRAAVNLLSENLKIIYI